MKVILGFVELALSLKFLSVADLAYGWHILDREVFIALWVAIFVCLDCICSESSDSSAIPTKRILVRCA